MRRGGPCLAALFLLVAAPAGGQPAPVVPPRDLPGPPPPAGPTPPERLEGRREGVPDSGVIRPPETPGAVVMPQVPAPGQSNMPVIPPPGTPGGAAGPPAR